MVFLCGEYIFADTDDAQPILVRCKCLGGVLLENGIFILVHVVKPCFLRLFSQENLDKGLVYLERGVLSAARRGKVSKKVAEATKTLLTPALSIKAAKDCDLVSTDSTVVVRTRAELTTVGARGVLPKRLTLNLSLPA